MEFPEGWLIREDLPGRGGALKVGERESVKIRRFPSRIAPERVPDWYETVIETGREVSISDIRP
ncbi:hypothetical protein FRACA_1620002 [Frankia canadensis]|uniref:Uncharacterized protein n=1 Tax=Frankia canadensis TaxID=1836972 RepID=A0A2I2KMN8_9ACTN|nr:hypothetical protein FRACA_1620002 [Frankia canadensis]SOU54227.1 hypothetical protein FRACA_1620002 [Frankia canadensis]